MTPASKVRLKELIRGDVVTDVRVAFEKFRNFFILCNKVSGDNFDNAKDSRLVEIVYKCLNLLRDGKIVTAREDVRNKMLLLCKAVKPEVFAQTHLCNELSVLGEVIVKVPWLQVLRRAFEVANVEPNVKVYFCTILGDLAPAKLLNRSSIIRLSVE